MTQQGPILLICSEPQPALIEALERAHLFPIVNVGWTEALSAISGLQPAAVIAVPALTTTAQTLERVAATVSALAPYTPLIVVDTPQPVPANALPLSLDHGLPRLGARLSGAWRVRALHAAVLRRAETGGGDRGLLAGADPIEDASILLIGRGGTHPALSVAFGERMGVVGALSIEAAAKHLNTRDIDGIVIGDGFTPRVVDAFLTVLAEDSRFRSLPVVLASPAADLNLSTYELPNLEASDADAVRIARLAMPLIRQQAFASRLQRAQKSLEAGGITDPRTGLLTESTFDRDLALAIKEALNSGASLSAACFRLDAARPRERYDSARIISRLMRRVDFATLRADGSVILIFPGADSRAVQAISKRLASVLRYSMHGPDGRARLDLTMTHTTLQSGDTPHSLLSRLDPAMSHAASGS